MTVYVILNGATVSETAVPNVESQIVQPQNAYNFKNATQQWQAVLSGVGNCSASIQPVGSNDGKNWTAIGSGITVSGSSVDLQPANAGFVSTDPYEYFSGYVTAISGTNAEAELRVTA